MSKTRKIEVFTAGCPVCEEAVAKVREMACPSCEVKVLSMHTPNVVSLARELGVRSLPAVAIDGQLAGCCAGRGIDEQALRQAGLGQPLS